MTEEKDTLDSGDEVVLVDEDGVEHTFVMLDVIEVDGAEYAILQPVEESQDEEEQEAIILKIETDEKGEEVLVDIENDEEWEKVADAWQDMMEDESDAKDS